MNIYPVFLDIPKYLSKNLWTPPYYILPKSARNMFPISQNTESFILIIYPNRIVVATIDHLLLIFFTYGECYSYHTNGSKHVDYYPLLNR